MNISLQCCGLTIVVFLLILYRSHKRLNLIGERVFFRMLILIMTCITLDALSVFAIHYREMIPYPLMVISCKAYLISMIWVGWINFCYVMLDINSSLVKFKRTSRIMMFITAAESIVIALLSIDVYDQDGDLYSFGPTVIATYIFTLLYIIFTLNIAVFISKKKSSRRGMAVIMTTLLWILAAAVQATNNQLLLVGFSMACGAMILYIVMENPDSNLDKNLGCFNTYALHRYLAMKLKEGKRFGIMDLSIIDVKGLNDKGISVDNAGKRVISELKNSHGVFVFKNLSTGLIAIADNIKEFEELNTAILKIESQYEDSSRHIMIVTLDDAQQFESSDDLLKFLTYLRSKSSARLSSNVHVTAEQIKQYKEQERIEKEIEKALKEDRVEIFLQPIVSTTDEKIVSAESLVRIRNIDGSLMSPGMFIPVAEATGQIMELGERVLEKVCLFLRDSEAISLGIKTIHVNLSAVQCDDNSTAKRLSQIVENYGVDPKYIDFEITETAVSGAKDILIENMNALISKGFHFALDDFGKGESNLMYIVDLPVNLIKIDMDMSKAFFINPKAKIVMGSISQMADKLNLPIVAEGIETKDEVDGIKSEGVSFIQGYYYSRPLPTKDFIEFLKSNHTVLSQNTEPVIAENVTENQEKNVFKITSSKVLVVEDNEINAEIATDILEENGFEVDVADDGVVAVEKMTKSAENEYGFILMDIRMPIMDGYEATRRIRALGSDYCKNIPIIALTSEDSEETRKAAFESGMNEHMTKPINFKMLEAMIIR